MLNVTHADKRALCLIGSLNKLHIMTSLEASAETMS